jgi:hypothetical protein
MILPDGAPGFGEAIRYAAEDFYTLKKSLHETSGPPRRATKSVSHHRSPIIKRRST